MKLVDMAGRPWIISTAGLWRRRQPFAMPFAPSDGDEALLLLDTLVEYVRTQKPVSVAQTFAYGITHLHFRAPDATEHALVGDALVIQELAEPLRAHPHEWSYVDGAHKAMRLRLLHDETMERLRQRGPWRIPHGGSFAAICTLLKPTATNLYMERSEDGWVFLCDDEAHHQSEDFVQPAHLIDAVERFPFVVPYLGAHQGSAVRFADDRIVFIAPGAGRGELDTAARWRARDLTVSQ